MGAGVDSLYEEQYSVLANAREDLSGKDTPISEHHYDVPLIGSSLDSPASSETHHLLASHCQLATPTIDSVMMYSKRLDSPMSSLEKSCRSASPLSLVSDATSGR